MRARRLPQHIIERPEPPLKPELAELVRRQPALVCQALAPLMAEGRIERIEQILSARTRSVVLVLDRLHDPHNGAAVLRTAEALGLMEVHAIMPGGRWDLSRRVTLGCHKWLDVVVHREADDCAGALIPRGYTLLAASEEVSDDSALDLPSEQPVAICMGNEQRGITEALRRHCQGVVGIPMFGFSRSLNVSVAAAILISRLVEGRGRVLENEDREQLRARYYALSVREPLEVLRRQGVR